MTKFVGIEAKNRQTLIDYIIEKVEPLIVEKKIQIDVNAPVLRIQMPCKEVIEYKTFADIPEKDIKCSCGNEDHWFIEYEEKGL